MLRSKAEVESLLVVSLTSIVVLLSPGRANATTVQVSGNRVLDNATIDRVVRRVVCDLVDSMCVKAVCDSVVSLYWHSGYLDAEARCFYANEDTLRIDIEEGQPSVLESLIVEGIDQAEAVREILPRENRLSTDLIEQAVSAVLAHFDNLGYPLCKVSPQIQETGSGRFVLVLKVTPGPPARIKSVRFDGAKTKQNVLLRESGIKIGAIYRGRDLSEARRRIARLDVVESVSEPQITFDRSDSTVEVSFKVSELPGSSLSGVVTLAPGLGESKFYGSINVRLMNIGGTLRQATILWNRLGSTRLDWSLSYHEPHLLSAPFAVGFAVSGEVNEGYYERRKLRVGIKQILSYRITSSASLFWAWTTEESLPGDEHYSATETIERGVAINVTYDARDRKINPSSGEMLDIGLEVASRSAAGSQLPQTLWTIRSEGTLITPVGGNLAVVWKCGYDAVMADRGRIPYLNLIKVGGFGSLRGYPEEWFFARRALIAALEIRLLTGRYSNLHVFIDCGSLQTEDLTILSLNDLLIGYGFGLQVYSRIGVLEIDVASHKDEALSEAKLHIGIVRRF